jgi:hypothetical protein
MPRAGRFFSLALLVLLIGLAAAPRVFHDYDVVDCFLPWARASEGLRPWGVYTPGAGADDCDYPPLVPYLLTAAEAGRRAGGAEEVGPTSIRLLKLPALLAHAALVPLALLGLRGLLGPKRAAVVAVLLALSPALFVNTALWGQYDVVVMLPLLGAVVALLKDRPVLAGVLMGTALATKLLAVVAVPLMAAWVWRRQGLRRVLQACAAGASVVVLLALPHVLGGRGEAVARAYTGAVNYYPYRTAEAYNGWYVLDRYDMRVRGIPGPVARRDDRPFLGPLTYRQLGLLAFSGFTLLVVLAVLRRPEPVVLLWALAIHHYGFFMLPTQVHQRYIVPAAVFFALLAPLSRRAAWLFAGVTLTAALNQGIDLARALPVEPLVAGALTAADLPLATPTARDLGALIGLVNVALFLAACHASWREAVAPPPVAKAP